MSATGLSGPRRARFGWASGAQSKSIEIDLGQIGSVDGLTFASGADTRSQVTFPLAVMVFLSDDGRTYSYAGDLINEAVNQEQHAIHTFKIEGLAAQARFVRLQTISGGYYVFVDEIEVLGSKQVGLKTAGPQANARHDRPVLKRPHPTASTEELLVDVSRPCTFTTGRRARQV